MPYKHWWFVQHLKLIYIMCEKTKEYNETNLLLLTMRKCQNFPLKTGFLSLLKCLNPGASVGTAPWNPSGFCPWTPPGVRWASGPHQWGLHSKLLTVRAVPTPYTSNQTPFGGITWPLPPPPLSMCCACHWFTVRIFPLLLLIVLH